MLRYLLILLLFSTSVIADADDDLKYANVGIKLLASTLAADQKIVDKRVNDTLRIALICNSPIVCKNLLKGIDPIRVKELWISFVLMTADEIDVQSKVAGIFVAQRIKDISSLVTFAVANKIILFSPFDDDIARGATVSMSVTDKVVPVVNRNTMELSRIELKPFFLKVSKIE